MDRSWINEICVRDVYENGVEEFLQFAQRNVQVVNGRYFCLCVNCVNGKRLEIRLIREHVLCYGFLKNYIEWIGHGEFVDVTPLSDDQYSNIYSEARMEDMIRDIGEDSFQQAHMCDSLKDDFETPIYLDCSSFTRLSAILKLINIKAK